MLDRKPLSDRFTFPSLRKRPMFVFGLLRQRKAKSDKETDILLIYKGVFQNGGSEEDTAEP